MDPLHILRAFSVLSIYIIITVNTDFGFIIFIPIGIILMIISIFDAGHMFRVHKRLGGQQAYIYFASLPVSKRTCFVQIILRAYC